MAGAVNDRIDPKLSLYSEMIEKIEVKNPEVALGDVFKEIPQPSSSSSLNINPRRREPDGTNSKFVENLRLTVQSSSPDCLTNRDVNAVSDLASLEIKKPELEEFFREEFFREEFFRAMFKHLPKALRPKTEERKARMDNLLRQGIISEDLSVPQNRPQTMLERKLFKKGEGSSKEKKSILSRYY